MTATKVVEEAAWPTLREAAKRLLNFRSTFSKLSREERAALIENAKNSPEVSGEPEA